MLPWQQTDSHKQVTIFDPWFIPLVCLRWTPALYKYLCLDSSLAIAVGFPLFRVYEPFKVKTITYFSPSLQIPCYIWLHNFTLIAPTAVLTVSLQKSPVFNLLHGMCVMHFSQMFGICVSPPTILQLPFVRVYVCSN